MFETNSTYLAAETNFCTVAMKFPLQWWCSVSDRQIPDVWWVERAEEPAELSMPNNLHATAKKSTLEQQVVLEKKTNHLSKQKLNFLNR